MAVLGSLKAQLFSLTLTFFAASVFLFLGLNTVSAQNTANNATTTPENTISDDEIEVPAYTTEFISGDEVVGDFVLGPGKTELSLEPGQAALVELIVTNRTGRTRTFNLEVEDIIGSANPNKAVVLLGDDRGPYSLRDYIQLSATAVELEHTERARIPVVVAIPEDAEPGGLYGSVLVNTVAIEGEVGNTSGTAPQSAVITRVGSLFFVTVSGESNKVGKLVDFGTVPEKKWFSNGPIKFQLLFENDGTVHLNPYGEIRITNLFGDEVGFIELEPWYALPGSLRLREVEWDRGLLFGKYTATANINRGYEDVIDTMEYSFWVLPWKILLGVFVAVFIVLFLIRAFFRTFEFKRKGNY